MRKLTWMVLVLPLVVVAPAAAQQPFNPVVVHPAAGCTATPAELEANKTAALAFFRPGITVDERLALLDPEYIQHNPAFKKYADDNKLSYIEGFRQMFAQFAAAGRGRAGGAPAGPQPPAAAPFEWAMAECDTVFVLRKQMRQDPTAAAGTFYEAFTFDTFRVRNGKLWEHWDAAVINPPAPAGGRGGQ